MGFRGLGSLPPVDAPFDLCRFSARYAFYGHSVRFVVEPTRRARKYYTQKGNIYIVFESKCHLPPQNPRERVGGLCPPTVSRAFWGSRNVCGFQKSAISGPTLEGHPLKSVAVLALAGWFRTQCFFLFLLSKHGGHGFAGPLLHTRVGFHSCDRH